MNTFPRLARPLLYLSVTLAWVSLLTAAPVWGATRDWADATGGSFHASNNWNPMAVPDGSDMAVFDLGDESYTVTFTFDVQNRRMIVGDDTVTLDLQGAT